VVKKEDIPFLWGCATSSHQVEGNNTANDWWEWEKEGKVPQASGAACNHYQLFRQDIDLMARLGHNAHRLSLEWSRFEPEENCWNDEAFRHYEEVLKELRARGIEPVVTLHHFTNPLWFMKRGGWLRDDAVFYFNRYVKRVAAAYGSLVRFWITINEPVVYLFHGYYTGVWPPGIQSLRDSAIVFKHLLVAHAEAYRTIHKLYENFHRQSVWVSVAKHMTYLTPCRYNYFRDRCAVFLRNWFFNYLFLDAAASGFLFFPGVFCEFLPAHNTLDYLGVNYYRRDFVRFRGLSQPHSLGEACSSDHHRQQIHEVNSLGWEVYPHGLYYLLRSLQRYRLPVMVTENGVCTDDDSQRARFIQNHVHAVRRAMEDGVPVTGYFYWSGLDNFEWHHGFQPRFGIVEVNYENQERKIKESAQVLTECCRKLLSGEKDAK
jgi:beta-glucosidase